MTDKKETPEIETQVECKDIHHAINEVYKRIGYVAKKGVIEFGKNRSYKFAGEAEFIAAIRPEMVDIGIYQQPYNVTIVTNERIESEKEWQGVVTKTYQHRAVIQTVYRFTHKESGTFIDVPAIGEGMDSGDKSFNKAMTGANKYALRQLFMIETGDDPDKYASDENGGVITDKAKKVSAAAENRKFNAFCKLLQESENPTKFWQDNIREINSYRDEADGVEMTMLKFAHLAIIALIESSDDPASVIHEQNRLMTKMETEARIYFDAINNAARERKKNC